MNSKKKQVKKRSFKSKLNNNKIKESFNNSLKKVKLYLIGLWNPQFKMLLAYVFCVILAAALLIAPFSLKTYSITGSHTSYNFWDALFTSASAFSNTGLIISNTGDTLTTFGQVVMYILIQLGGFGLLSTFFLLGQTFSKFFGKEFKSIISHAERGQSKISSSIRAIVVIFFLIFCFQLIATFILWPIFYLHNFNITYNDVNNIGTPDLNRDNGVGFHHLGRSFWTALFLIGSATNNGGFDIFSGKANGSLETFFGGFGIFVQSITLIALIFGGIGYMVIYDIWKKFIYWISNKNQKAYQILTNSKINADFESKPRISIYTKICLLGNIIIIFSSLFFSYLIIWVSYKEFNGTIRDGSSIHSWLWLKLNGDLITGDLIYGDIKNFIDYGVGSAPKYSYFEVNFAIFFNTLSTRSAGFSTFNMAFMAESTKWLFSFLMMIGTSPSSTGGGIRVTTVVVIMFAISQKMRGQEYSTIFNKRISSKTQVNSLITLAIAASLVAFSTFFIAIFDKNIDFTDGFFISASAFGTTGLSSVSPDGVSQISFLTLIPLMIIGQTGITNTLETFNFGRYKYSRTKAEKLAFTVG